MANNRPTEITVNHLARKAAVYVRRSRGGQTWSNMDGVAYQRGQVRFPTLWE